jgi:hypothetical protein
MDRSLTSIPGATVPKSQSNTKLLGTGRLWRAITSASVMPATEA